MEYKIIPGKPVPNSRKRPKPRAVEVRLIARDGRAYINTREQRATSRELADQRIAWRRPRADSDRRPSLPMSVLSLQNGGGGWAETVPEREWSENPSDGESSVDSRRQQHSTRSPEPAASPSPGPHQQAKLKISLVAPSASGWRRNSFPEILLSPRAQQAVAESLEADNMQLVLEANAAGGRESTSQTSMRAPVTVQYGRNRTGAPTHESSTSFSYADAAAKAARPQPAPSASPPQAGLKTVRGGRVGGRSGGGQNTSRSARDATAPESGSLLYSYVKGRTGRSREYFGPNVQDLVRPPSGVLRSRSKRGAAQVGGGGGGAGSQRSSSRSSTDRQAGSARHRLGGRGGSTASGGLGGTQQGGHDRSGSRNRGRADAASWR